MEEQTIVLEPKVYTRAQRWLLLGALVIGLAWDFGWAYWAPEWYNDGMFWILYLVVFYLFNWEALKRNYLCWALGIAAVLICISQNWQRKDELYALALVARPLLLMTHAVFATNDIPIRREGQAVMLVLEGFFVKPFTAIPDSFRAFGSLFKRREQGAAKRVLLGLAIGLPLALVVLLLLSSADEVMGHLLGTWFRDISIGEILWHAVNIVAATILFYSFLYNSRWGKRKELTASERPKAPPVTASVVLVLLLLVYAVFAYVQFRYFFSGQLPADMTYSEYARSGFWELIVVMLINISAYTAINALCREGGALRVLQCLLMAATALLLTSAIMRLIMYISAYGLTIMRILPLWLMIWLAAMIVLAVVRLFRKRTPMLRIAAISLVWWYVALNMPNWAQIISSVNARYF